MKLKELLDEIFNGEHKPQNEFMDYTLFGKDVLEPYKERLLQTDEFKGCEVLNLLSMPVFSEEERTYQAQTFKLGEGQRFSGKGYLLSIAYTPEMFA